MKSNTVSSNINNKIKSAFLSNCKNIAKLFLNEKFRQK